MQNQNYTYLNRMHILLADNMHILFADELKEASDFKVRKKKLEDHNKTLLIRIISYFAYIRSTHNCLPE